MVDRDYLFTATQRRREGRRLVTHEPQHADVDRARCGVDLDRLGHPDRATARSDRAVNPVTRTRGEPRAIDGEREGYRHLPALQRQAAFGNRPGIGRRALAHLDDRGAVGRQRDHDSADNGSPAPDDASTQSHASTST
jgi:hypothetical protein